MLDEGKPAGRSGPDQPMQAEPSPKDQDILRPDNPRAEQVRQLRRPVAPMRLAPHMAPPEHLHGSAGGRRAGTHGAKPEEQQQRRVLENPERYK